MLLQGRKRDCGGKERSFREQCGRELLEGRALSKVYIRSGSRKGGDSGILGASERTLWAVEGPAEAPGEVLPASGTLVLQSWLRRLGRCLPVGVHRGLRWRRAWQGRKKRIALRWG